MSGGRERDEGTGARRLRERRDRGAHLLPQWRQGRWGPRGGRRLAPPCGGSGKPLQRWQIGPPPGCGHRAPATEAGAQPAQSHPPRPALRPRGPGAAGRAAATLDVCCGTAAPLWLWPHAISTDASAPPEVLTQTAAPAGGTLKGFSSAVPPAFVCGRPVCGPSINLWAVYVCGRLASACGRPVCGPSACGRSSGFPGSSVCGPSSHSGLLRAYHSTAFGPAVQVPRHLRASHAPLGSGRLRVLLTATAQAMCLWALARGLLTTCCGHGHSLQQFGAVPLSCGCSEAAGVRL